MVVLTKMKNKKWFERLYFGTWQFSGQFQSYGNKYIESLIKFALKQGIINYETAIVYNNGILESILGKTLPEYTRIITKIPAINKPSDDDAVIKKYYNRQWITRNVKESFERLGRKRIYGLLFHNWARAWDTKADEILKNLAQFKRRGIVQKIGISLPNNFNHSLNSKILSYIDIIEAPFNPLNIWIKNDLEKLKKNKIEVILRSIYNQGMLLKTQEEIDKLSASDIRKDKYVEVKKYAKLKSSRDILTETMKLETSIVIGMTKKKQIIENINIIGGKEN